MKILPRMEDFHKKLKNASGKFFRKWQVCFLIEDAKKSILLYDTGGFAFCEVYEWSVA